MNFQVRVLFQTQEIFLQLLNLLGLKHPETEQEFIWTKPENRNIKLNAIL